MHIPLHRYRSLSLTVIRDHPKPPLPVIPGFSCRWVEMETPLGWQTITPDDIARTEELAKKHGWNP